MCAGATRADAPPPPATPSPTRPDTRLLDQTLLQSAPGRDRAGSTRHASAGEGVASEGAQAHHDQAIVEKDVNAQAQSVNEAHAERADQTSPFPEPELSGILSGITERHSSLQRPRKLPPQQTAAAGAGAAFPVATHRKQSRFALARAPKAAGAVRPVPQPGIHAASATDAQAGSMTQQVRPRESSSQEQRLDTSARAGASGEGNEEQMATIGAENDAYLSRLSATEVRRELACVPVRHT